MKTTIISCGKEFNRPDKTRENAIEKNRKMMLTYISCLKVAETLPLDMPIILKVMVYVTKEHSRMEKDFIVIGRSFNNDSIRVEVLAKEYNSHEIHLTYDFKNNSHLDKYLWTIKLRYIKSYSVWTPEDAALTTRYEWMSHQYRKMAFEE